LKRGLDVTASELDIATRNISQQNGLTEEQLLGRLATSNITEAEFRQSMEEQILIQKVVNGQVSRFIRVNDQEVDQFIKSYPDLFEVNVSYELSHLRITLADLDTEQANIWRKNLARIRSNLLAGRELEESMEASGFDDVDFEYLGWKDRSQIPDQIVAEIENSVPGPVTSVLEISNALHLFVIHRRQGDEIIVTQMRVRQILINPNQKLISSDESLELANEIRRRIQSGEDFASLARKFSDDRNSSAEGGELGWLNPDDVDPQLVKAISGLNMNELSEPVSTLFGYYLIEVLETRNRNILQDKIRTRASDIIFSRKANSQLSSWIARIRSESYIEVLGVN